VRTRRRDEGGSNPNRVRHSGTRPAVTRYRPRNHTIPIRDHPIVRITQSSVSRRVTHEPNGCCRKIWTLQSKCHHLRIILYMAGRAKDNLDTLASINKSTEIDDGKYECHNVLQGIDEGTAEEVVS
jgi:hypothetical protein